MISSLLLPDAATWTQPRGERASAPEVLAHEMAADTTEMLEYVILCVRSFVRLFVRSFLRFRTLRVWSPLVSPGTRARGARRERL